MGVKNGKKIDHMECFKIFSCGTTIPLVIANMDLGDPFKLCCASLRLGLDVGVGALRIQLNPWIEFKQRAW